MASVLRFFLSSMRSAQNDEPDLRSNAALHPLPLGTTCQRNSFFDSQLWRSLRMTSLCSQLNLLNRGKSGAKGS